MSGNLGYLFYRCAYREQVENAPRLKESEHADDKMLERVGTDTFALADLGEQVKPYRVESVPPPTEMNVPQNAQPAVKENATDGQLNLARLLQLNQPRSRREEEQKQKEEARRRREAEQRQKDAARRRREYRNSLAAAENKARAANNIDTFDLQVLYPGIYAGLGYAHGLPKQEKDITNGFSFDYTTGLPYIPGSSLKGMLRSHFIEHAEDVKFALEEIVEQEVDNKAMREMETLLFGNRSAGDAAQNAEREQAQQGVVIFHDVFPVLTEQGISLMSTDNITPHNAPLAPPKPINTIRIRPGVKLRFYFGMPQDQYAGFGKEQVLALFRQLLIDWGIGAKTNVGYGSLDVPSK